MIKILRNSDRLHVLRGKKQVWSTFSAKNNLVSQDGDFGFLLTFDELRLQPGGCTESHWDHETEIVTYVYKGALSREDTVGGSGVIHTGEFQRTSTGRRIRYKETSVSGTDSVHLFRMSLRPAQAGLDCSHEQRRFTEAQRHNLLCAVASPDKRKGSLLIHQDVFVYSAILDPGHHLVYEVALGRTVWLHMVCGEAVLKDNVLTQGDGVGAMNERSVSLTVQENTEVLLVDLGPTGQPPWEKLSRTKP